MACWSSAQQAEIKAYQTNFKAKLVVMYTVPATSNGVETRPEGGLTINGAKATFAQAFAPAAPFFKTETTVDISGVFG